MQAQINTIGPEPDSTNENYDQTGVKITDNLSTISISNNPNINKLSSDDLPQATVQFDR